MLEQFHTGIRVPDLAAAMSEIGQALGLDWAEPMEAAAQPLWTPEHGQQELPLKFVYSREGPNHLELLEGPAGSFWDGSVQPGVHHVGVWCDDVAAETTRMIGAGWTLVASRRSPDEGYGSYTYLAPPSGVIVELVATEVRPRFEAWWSGEAL